MDDLVFHCGIPHGHVERKQEFDDVDGSTKLRPSCCLADFVASQFAINSVAVSAGSTWATGPNGTPIKDYAGLFAVTAGIDAEKRGKISVDTHDDYSSIMLKSIADGLAEAFADCLHHRVRTDLWGYAPDEALAADALIAEKYQGIRPAPGYPATRHARTQRQKRHV